METNHQPLNNEIRGENSQSTIKTIGFLDIKKLEARFFKDADFLNEMLSNYIVTSKNCLEEMELAERNHNPVILANSCHKLLGSTLNFSNGYITHFLEDIEINAREHSKIIVTASDINHLKSLIESLQEQLSSIANSWRTGGS